MTYTRSLAQAGRTSTFAIGSGTPTLIGEVSSASLDGNAWEFAEVSNFQSGVDEEFIPTMRNNGEFKVTGNSVSTDAGQILVETAYNTGALATFTYTKPLQAAQATPGKWVMQGYVQSRTFSAETKKQITYNLTIKITSTPVFTEGS